MFKDIFRELKCNFCGKKGLRYNPQATFESYSDPESFVLDDVDKLVDGIIAEYLEYECINCGATTRYMIGDIEKIIRKRISERVIYLAAKSEIVKSGALASKEKIFIYCGKCNGGDSKGSCLLQTYKKCKIKRFPCL